MVSAFNVDNVFFQRAKWKLKLLIPAWIFQVVVLLGLMGIFAYRVAETVEHYSDRAKNGEIPMVEIVWESTNVAFSTVALVCTLTEIAKTATETLTPFAMVCTHILKLTLALAMLSLDIVVHIQGLDREYSIVGLSLDCGFLAVAVLTLTYTVITYRRLLAYETYQVPTDTKPSRPAGDLHGAPQSRAPSATYRDLELGNRVSISSAHASFRDRDSTGDLGSEVVRGIGVEWGWSSTSRPGSGSRARTSSIVGSGVVPSGKVSPTPPSSGGQLKRAKSCIPEIGGADDADDDYDVVRRGSGGSGGGYDGRVPEVRVELHEDEEGGEEDTRRLLGKN